MKNLNNFYTKLSLNTPVYGFYPNFKYLMDASWKLWARILKNNQKRDFIVNEYSKVSGLEYSVNNYSGSRKKAELDFALERIKLKNNRLIRLLLENKSDFAIMLGELKKKGVMDEFWQGFKTDDDCSISLNKYKQIPLADIVKELQD